MDTVTFVCSTHEELGWEKKSFSILLKVGIAQSLMIPGQRTQKLAGRWLIVDNPNQFYLEKGWSLTVTILTHGSITDWCYFKVVL